MGSMSKMLGMLPGMNSGAMKRQLDSLDDNELVRTEAIIQSMTPAERGDVKILNGTRRARIAKGSGRQVSEVNTLVDRFTAAQKMMRQMRNGGGALPGMPPGMTSMPGMPAAKKVAPPRRNHALETQQSVLKNWANLNFI